MIRKFFSDNWPLIVLLFIAVGAVSVLSWAIYPAALSRDISRWGSFGDYLNGLLTPLVGLFALLYLIKTYRDNKAELTETRRHIALQTILTTFNALRANLDQVRESISFGEKHRGHEAIQHILSGLYDCARSTKLEKSERTKRVTAQYEVIRQKHPHLMRLPLAVRSLYQLLDSSHLILNREDNLAASLVVTRLYNSVSSALTEPEVILACVYRVREPLDTQHGEPFEEVAPGVIFSNQFDAALRSACSLLAWETVQALEIENREHRSGIDIGNSTAQTPERTR